MEKIKNLWNTFVSKLKEDKKFRITSIIVAAVVVVAIVAIIVVACVSGGNSDQPVVDPSNPTETTGATVPSVDEGELYCSVTVVDAKGNPVPGAIVNFMQNGAAVGMQQTNENGVAEKVLPEGEYTVELAFTDASANYTYDTASAVVNKDNSAITITLYNALGEGKELFAYSTKEDAQVSYTAYYVSEGSTLVSLTPGDRTYFIFVPAKDGVYKFSTDNAELTIGYFGSTYFVQAENLSELAEDGSFSIDVAPGSINQEGGAGTVSYVLGVDSAEAAECVITIERTGEHVITYDELPWDIYQKTVELEEYTLPEGVNLIDFDVTASTDTYNLVFNEADGFYHMDTVDGPLVYVKLGVSSTYMDSFQTVLDNSGLTRYFFDENGEFISKESYTECMLEYIQYMDENAGVYPLTEDLKYIIQQRGEYVGWWEEGAGMFIFYDKNANPIVGLNKDIAWLFACCYADSVPEATDPTEGTEATDPTESTQPDNTDKNNNSSSGSDRNNDSSSGSDKNNNSSSGSDKNNNSSSGSDKNNNSSSGSDKNNNSSSGSDKNDSSSGSDKNDNSSSGSTDSTEPTEDEKPIGERSKDANGKDVTYETGMNETLETEVIAAGEYVEYKLWRYTHSFYMNIESEDAYIIYNDEVYWPDDNGVVSVYIPAPSISGAALTVYIGNAGSSDQAFTLENTEKVGSMGNPATLKLKNNQASLTVHVTEEDTQGYWYTYTATADGTLSVTLKDTSSADMVVTCNRRVQSETGGTVVIPEQITLDDVSGNTITIDVKEGEVVTITFSAVSTGSGSSYDVDYKDTVIKATVKFTAE